MLQAKLIVVGGGEHEAVFELRLPAQLGRGRDNDITLPHPLVSRKHCEIYEKDGKLFVRDLGSLNGTFIGSDRISNRVLRPGELLTVGTVTFRAIYGDYRPDEAGADVESVDQTVLTEKPLDTEPGDTSLRKSTSTDPGPFRSISDDETQQAPEASAQRWRSPDRRSEIRS